MYLYFEDWSEWISTLEEKGLPHGDLIIKVYSSREHPSVKYQRDTLACLEVDHAPFRPDEVFSYEGRGSFTGSEIEAHLATLGLSTEALDRVRALFRFSNQQETQFAQEGMKIQKDGEWLISHPIHEIDGLEWAAKAPERRAELVHLDIFVPSSVERLLKFIGFRTETGAIHPEKIISQSERMAISRESRNFKPNLKER